jgi:hypothetical protein
MEPYAAIDSLCVNARSSTPWLTIEFDVPRQQRFDLFEGLRGRQFGEQTA